MRSLNLTILKLHLTRIIFNVFLNLSDQYIKYVRQSYFIFAINLKQVSEIKSEFMDFLTKS